MTTIIKPTMSTDSRGDMWANFDMPGQAGYIDTSNSYFKWEYKLAPPEPPNARRPPLSKLWIAMRQKLLEYSDIPLLMYDILPEVLVHIILDYVNPWGDSYSRKVQEMTKKHDFYYENLLYYEFVNNPLKQDEINWLWLIAASAAPKSPMPTISAWNRMKAMKRRQKKRAHGSTRWRS